MKKIIFILACIIAVIIAGSAYFLFYYGGGDYVNKKIPTGYKYTQKNDAIPSSMVIQPIKTKIGDSMEYFDGNMYDTTQMHQIDGKYFCKNTDNEAETIRYFSHSPRGVMPVMGGTSGRIAVVCDKTYWISDFTDAQGEILYGPFSLNDDTNQNTNTSAINTNANQRCAQFSVNGNSTQYCATCGNGICEPHEYCSSSSVSCDANNDCLATQDCGGLYCPQDCE